MRYITSKAMLFAYGTYTYQPLTIRQALEWIKGNGNIVSAGLYGDAAVLYEQMFESPKPEGTSESSPYLKRGEQALIVRMTKKAGSRGKAGSELRSTAEEAIKNGDYELALLTRVL